MGQAGEIIEGEQVAVVGRDHQLPLFARERPYRGGIGVDRRFEKFAQHAVLAEPCSPEIASSG